MPPWIEMQNLSNSIRGLQDVNLVLYNERNTSYFDKYDKEHNFVLDNAEGDWTEKPFPFNGE